MLAILNEDDGKLKGHVNSSGFPLQLGIERIVEESKFRRGWHVIAREQPWRNEESKTGGFVDLVIEDQHRVQAMVIECKRVRDASWVFLVPNERETLRGRVNAWVRYDKDESNKYFDWHDLMVDPATQESEFCVIAGEGSKSRTMLERTAAELVDATEALAFEELQISDPDMGNPRIYFSVIITTAELKVCNINPSEIDINTGELDSGRYSTVPFIRFRKSLTIRPSNLAKASSLVVVAGSSERTVCVVNSGSFREFLEGWALNWPPSWLKPTIYRS